MRATFGLTRVTLLAAPLRKQFLESSDIAANLQTLVEGTVSGCLRHPVWSQVTSVIVLPENDNPRGWRNQWNSPIEIVHALLPCYRRWYRDTVSPLKRDSQSSFYPSPCTAVPCHALILCSDRRGACKACEFRCLNPPSDTMCMCTLLCAVAVVTQLCCGHHLNTAR